MSKPTKEEITATTAEGGEAAAAPARKRAAKKTAAKKVATKAAKKTVAKKSASKKATASTEDSAPAPQVESAGIAPAGPTPVSQPVSPSAAETAGPADEGRRYGRVPGGGPLVARAANEAPAAAPAAVESAAAPAHPPQHANRDNQPRESRSKRRREKRKRRNNERQGQQAPQGGGHRSEARPEHRSEPRPEQPADPGAERPQALSGPRLECDGMLELAPKGFGFLRVPSKNFEQVRDDVFVSPETIRKFHLRIGQWIHGLYQTGPRGAQLVEVSSINGMPPEEASKLPHFDELKAVNPAKRISFETTPERFTTRVVDIMAPVGRGQRGLIVSPPRSGKTTLLLHMAEAIREKYDEAIHLMVLLVDERPEEVTEFRRALPGAEIYASSNDEQPRNHCRIAELAIERAKRLVEAGQDVFLLMDSITRLARAYNNTMGNRGRGTGSGGITIGALEVPRRLFAAARNTRGGGSLTIMATALIQTNSRADEAIFMEFKGTGNMELVLDRKIAENYIYPAVDIFKSGTRREEILIPDHMLHKIHLIRRGLSGHRPVEAMERLLFFLKKFSNNPQMLLEIKG
jgi:transcription termination factor Rho